MAFGKKYGDEEIDERGFKAVIQEGMQLSAAPNLGDFIPAIAWLDLQGFTRKMKRVHKVYDEFLEKIINEHLVARGGKKTRDFVDVMLDLIGSQQTEYQIDRSAIKAIMLVCLPLSSISIFSILRLLKLFIFLFLYITYLKKNNKLLSNYNERLKKQTFFFVFFLIFFY
uniref:Cytochrome P450 n=1 Tax=Cucumis sativus TaxID=3659 RepID=A0A0A0KM18_CUCSA